MLALVLNLMTAAFSLHNDCMAFISQEGDLDIMLKKRNGIHMSEDEIMMKFVQICLGLLHVHNKVSSTNQCKVLLSPGRFVFFIWSLPACNAATAWLLLLQAYVAGKVSQACTARPS